MTSSASLWRRMQAQLSEVLAGLIDRRRVTGIESNGRLRVVTLDPNSAYEDTIPSLRTGAIEPGDDVVCIRLGGKMLAIGALRTGAADEPSIVAGDGSSGLAARMDHQHAGQGVDSVVIGQRSRAAGARSWVLGSGVGNYGDDTGFLVANEVYIYPSNGTGPTRLLMRNELGSRSTLEVTSEDVLVVDGARHIKQGDNPTTIWPINKQVASGGPFDLTIAPNATSPVIGAITSGACYDTGWRRSVDGVSYAYCFFHQWGWGWFPANGLVSI